MKNRRIKMYRMPTYRKQNNLPFLCRLLIQKFFLLTKWNIMEARKQVFDRRDTVSKYEGVLDAESVKFGTNFSAVGQLKANNNEQTMSA